MENILLAIDATNLDSSALNFACYLAKLSGSSITGVFLENLVENEKPVLVRMHGTRYLDWEIDEMSPEVKEKRKIMESNISLFKETCGLKGVSYSIHLLEGNPVTEMVAESRFADVIIVDAATSFKDEFEGVPTRFVKKLLKEGECPVIIAPEDFDKVEEIIFTYDGSRSAVFAMKQFTYLFPQLNDKKVTVFHVNENDEWDEEQKKMVGDWLKNHYSTVGFETPTGSASYELLSYLFLRKNIFIVMGAYGRSAVSRFFSHSHADMLLKTISQPIFISHQ